MKNIAVLICFLLIACRDKEEIVAIDYCDTNGKEILFSLNNGKFKIQEELQGSGYFKLVALDSNKATLDTLRTKIVFNKTVFDPKNNTNWYLNLLEVCTGNKLTDELTQGSIVLVSGLSYIRRPTSQFSNKVNSNNNSLNGIDIFFKISSIQKIE